MKNKLKELGLDLCADIFGSFMLAIGIYCFAEKVNIAPGGVSGIAIMIKYLFGLPVGIVTFVINIPLLVLAYKFLGKGFTLRTIRTLIFSTVIVDMIVAPYFPQYMGDRMLGSIFGGVCMGVGLGVVFLRGSTTGGVDILSCIIERKRPHIQLGTALMLIDCVILGASVLVFKNLESVLFGVVALFCQTKVIDGMICGVEKGRKILIISEKNEKIAKEIIARLGRTATLLEAEGAYTGNHMCVLMCIIRVQEYHLIKEIVHHEDPDAFMIVSEANQIMGEGFQTVKEIRRGN